MLSMGREVACIKASFYIIADGKRKCKENMIEIWIPLILKVSAGLAVKVALTCRTTFC